MASKLQTFINTIGAKSIGSPTPIKGTPVEVFSEKWNQDTANLHPPSDETVKKGLFSSFNLGDVANHPIPANPNPSFSDVPTEGAKTIANFATAPIRTAKRTLYDIPKEAYNLVKEQGAGAIGSLAEGAVDTGVKMAESFSKLGKYVEGAVSTGIQKATGTSIDPKSQEFFHKTTNEDIARGFQKFVVENPDQVMLILDGLNKTLNKGGSTQETGTDVNAPTQADINMRNANIQTAGQLRNSEIMNLGDKTQSMADLAKQTQPMPNTPNPGIIDLQSTPSPTTPPTTPPVDIVSSMAKPVIGAGNYLKDQITGKAGDILQAGKTKVQDMAVNAVESSLRNTANKYVATSKKLNQMESDNGTKPIETISSYGNKALPVLEHGKINPTEAEDFLKEQIGELSQIKNDAVFLNDNTVAQPDFHKYTFDMIDAQKGWTEMKKTAIKADVNKILDSMKASYKGDLTLSELDKIKTEQTGFSKTYKNPNAKFDYDAHGIIGKSSRGLVEMFTEDAPTKELNKLIQSHYDAIDLYESLRGKAPQGGILTRNMERATGGVVGAIAGSSAGHPFVGAVAGRLGADLIMGIANNHFISNPLKRMLINNMENVPAEVRKKALDYVDQNSPDIGELGDQSSIPNNQRNNPNIAPNTSNMSEPTNLKNDFISPNTSTGDNKSQVPKDKGEIPLTTEETATSKAFNQSSSQKIIGKVDGNDIVIGTFGKNAIERKTLIGQGDRLPVEEISKTLDNLTGEIYKAGDTSWRKDNLVRIASMPNGEKRAVITRTNQKGQEEIINTFKIGRDYETFINNLKIFGIPTGNRTQKSSLEPKQFDPLAYRDNSSITDIGNKSSLLNNILGINTAYASEKDVPSNDKVLSDNQSGTLTEPKQSFMDKLLHGQAINYKSRSLEESGQWIHDHGGSHSAEVTMYNPSKKQTDSSPTIMASGKKIYDGAIATSDYSIPLGTRVYVPELQKVFTVEDRMNRRYSPDKYGKVVFDIPTTTATSSDNKSAKNFGRQQMHFVIVGHDGREETKIEDSKGTETILRSGF